ncbi:sigma factor-like helix-turn-helix DNA-binding protein [Actinomadura sp. 3N407]|uniref:sigma factor-like helix-turn-helix DNA-binding protein n=1 Tax=Actinomadura sp. 3N407 TaxID=3457423 RepID=UPI003FCDEB2E
MRTVDREHYAGLLRLAYLVLDDGDAPLVRARRAAAGAARVRHGGYPAMRARLVAILLTDPPTGRHRLHRLFFEPAPAPPSPVRAALLELPPHERLAFLLRRDGLTAPEVAAELGLHIHADFRDVDRATAAVDARTGLDEAAQRAEIEAFEPDVVRLRPPRSARPAWRAAVAAVLTAALLAVAGFVVTRPGEGPGEPAAIDPRAWQATGTPSINEWPAQGGLRHDAGLLRRAADAWRAHRLHPPLGRVIVLYAGTVDGASLVVLRDSSGSRDAPSVAQYFERRLSRGVESVRRLGTGEGQLIMLGMTWRYLVPPWLRDVRAAVPSGRSPDWTPVAVRDGLSDPLPWNWFTRRCQNYVVFQMTFRPAAGGSPRTVTQLASHDPHSAAPRVSFGDPPEHRERFRWAALHAVACEGAATLSESGDLRLGHLWSGELPDGGGRATLLTVDASSQWAAPGTSILISGGGRALSERGGTNSHITSSAATMAAAVWWRSPRRWHLVAAAGPSVTRLKTVGELDSGEEGTDRRGGTPLLVVPGPRTGGAPTETARLPVVHVVAYETDGDRTVVSPS